MAQAKKNSYLVQAKMEGNEGGARTRKVNFLMMELQDIKNNKGAVTLQVRSIEHLQTWLKRDKRLSSELLIKPLDLTLDLVLGESEDWWKESG